MKRRASHSRHIAEFFLFALCLAFALTAGDFRPALTQAPEKRKLKIHTFNRMPLKVKQVKNLQREDDGWFRDLEIEVQNISNKPIYFISLIIEFPDIPAPPPEPRADGSTPSRSTTGFRMTYGVDRLMNVRELAAPGDPHLKPGETYVFKIPDSRVPGLEYLRREKNLPPEAADKIDIEFDIISLGDGTGYVGGQRMLYAKKKSSDRYW